MKERKYTSSNVLASLRAGPFREPAHAFLYEVRNGTGYSRKVTRSADAIVVSCWPSRGIWIAGIEVKVSRQDWKNELDQPEKAAEILKWCDFWWVAAPAGVVELAEVPQTWGAFEAPGPRGSVKMLREAPRLTPEPWDRLFVASMLRNAAATQEAARLAGRDEAHQKAREEFGVDAIEKMRGELVEAQRERDRFEQQLTYKTNDYDNLIRNVLAFEIEAGLPAQSVAIRSRGWDRTNTVGAQFKAAQLLAERPPGQLAKHFRDVADALDAVAHATKVAS